MPARFARNRKKILGFIRGGRDLAQALGSSSLLGEIEQLAASADKPFLFVVVGEVKSGKSSLINALLSTPLCAVDSAPCTDRIQEINYGDEARRIQVSEFEERLYLPHDILRHIAVVDTPGTNSILRRHQHTTENYIPQSDLILFVFFAKNPYTGSAWDFLRQIKHDWQRNTLFVLQQTDLLTKEERERTLALVRQQLAEEGITKPLIFEVSALTGEGVDGLQDYLRTTLVKGRQFNKNISLTHNLLRFLRRMDRALEEHVRLLELDEERLDAFRELVLESDTRAREAYETLAGRAREQAEATRRWLETHFGADRRTAGLSPADTALRAPQGQSWDDYLRRVGQALTKSVAVRDALSGGWETPLRIAERFHQVQGEFNRCLFQGELRSLELRRSHRQRAQRLLDPPAGQPTGPSESPDDRIARQRLKTLRQARNLVRALGEPQPDHAVSRPPSMRPRTRWSPGEHLAQVGASLGSLVFGYYFADLFAALLFGLTGYLGAGYGLAVRHRRRVVKQARETLQRSIARIEQILGSILLSRPGRPAGAIEEALGLCETDVRNRHAKVGRLRESIGELRRTVEHYESAAWLDAVQGED